MQFLTLSWMSQRQGKRLSISPCNTLHIVAAKHILDHTAVAATEVTPADFYPAIPCMLSRRKYIVDHTAVAATG
jgi:hypothetical protein